MFYIRFTTSLRKRTKDGKIDNGTKEEKNEKSHFVQRKENQLG